MLRIFFYLPCGLARPLIWVVVDIVVACLVDCWLLGDCIGKNRNTSSGQDFRIYSLKIHLQDKDIVTLHGIYSKNID